MKKNIAIVAGEIPPEIVISLKSADGIYSFIDIKTNIIYILPSLRGMSGRLYFPSGEHTPIDKNDFSFKENGVTRHFDFAYITIHGTPGRGRTSARIFRYDRYAFTRLAGMLVSALTFNKYVCNHYLKDFGVKLPHPFILFKGESTVTGRRSRDSLPGLPIFVKPNDDRGSSFGVTKVKEVSAIQPRYR